MHFNGNDIENITINEKFISLLLAEKLIIPDYREVAKNELSLIHEILHTKTRNSVDYGFFFLQSTVTVNSIITQMPVILKFL